MATAAELQTREKIFIGGEWVEPDRLGDDRGGQLDDRGGDGRRSRPARPRTSTARCAAARAAFDAWSRTLARGARRLPARAIAAGLGERAEEIAATIAQELGMPLKLSQIDPGRPADRPVRGDAAADGGGRLGGGDRQLAGRARAGRRASARSRRGTTRCTRSPPRSRRRSPPAAPSCSSRARSRRSTPSSSPR